MRLRLQKYKKHSQADTKGGQPSSHRLHITQLYHLLSSRVIFCPHILISSHTLSRTHPPFSFLSLTLTPTLCSTTYSLHLTTPLLSTSSPTMAALALALLLLALTGTSSMLPTSLFFYSPFSTSTFKILLLFSTLDTLSIF